MRPVLTALCLLAAVGCGKPTLYPARGEVRVGGKPAPGVRLFFTVKNRSESTPGTRIGVGYTDDHGQFEITSGVGEPGLERGEYHVTFSRPLLKGKTIQSTERPDGVQESVPMPYCDHRHPENSPATARVDGTTAFTFDLPNHKR